MAEGGFLECIGRGHMGCILNLTKRGFKRDECPGRKSEERDTDSSIYLIPHLIPSWALMHGDTDTPISYPGFPAAEPKSSSVMMTKGNPTTMRPLQSPIPVRSR